MTAVEDAPQPIHKHIMAPSKTLNAANLAELGAPLLAELLIEISKGNAAAQRRLRLALAGSAGGEQAARAVAKRLASIARARTWLGWQKIKPFVAELEAQRRAILELVAPFDPHEAFDLLWRLVGCAPSVLARSDDGGGRLSGAFHAAARDLAPMAQRAGLSPQDLAARVSRVLTGDGRGAWDALIPLLAPQLGAAGLDMIRRSIREWQAEPVPTHAADERRVMDRPSSGPIHTDGAGSLHRRHRAAVVLRQVADALGDVDGFIEQFDERARAVPDVAATIARRLLGAGRTAEAWAALERVEPERRDQDATDWEEVRAHVLEALGRAEEAQVFRWARFVTTLNATHLRAYLKRLPDFDDFEAEQRALTHALTFGNVHQALSFFLVWPDLHRANELVLGRPRAFNGDLYELLSTAADTLDDKHPLAATLLRRAMIEFTLGAGRSSRYKHAARQLRDCRASAERVLDFGGAPDHGAFERALRTTHGRKSGFWQQVGASDGS